MNDNYIISKIYEQIQPKFDILPKNLMYDFGGSEYVSEPNNNKITTIIVVDKIKIQENETEGFDVRYIRANIFKPINLPSLAAEINISKVLRYARNIQEIEIALDNADRYLISGGMLNIFEDSGEEVEDNYDFLIKQIMQIMSTKTNYNLIKKSSANFGEIELLIYKKK